MEPHFTVPANPLGGLGRSTIPATMLAPVFNIIAAAARAAEPAGGNYPAEMLIDRSASSIRHRCIRRALATTRRAQRSLGLDSALRRHTSTNSSSPTAARRRRGRGLVAEGFRRAARRAEPGQHRRLKRCSADCR